MIFIKTPCEGWGRGGGNLMHSTVIFPRFGRARPVTGANFCRLDTQVWSVECRK